MRSPSWLNYNSYPVAKPFYLVLIVKLETLQIELSASPLKPKLFNAYMFSYSDILEVVPLLAIISKSASFIPLPSSLTSKPFNP